MDELKRRLLTRQTGYWTDCFPVAVFLSLMLMLVGMMFSRSGRTAETAAVR